MPPALRSKARFLNLFPLVEWAEKIHQHCKALSRQAKAALSFLNKENPLLKELGLLQGIIKERWPVC